MTQLVKKEGELLAEKKKEEAKKESDNEKKSSDPEDDETVTDEDLNLKIEPEDDFSSPESEEGLNLDGRTWVLGHRQEKQDNFILEFVQEDETVEDWTELITVQGFAKRMTAKQFAQGLEQSLRQNVAGELTWRILDEKEEGNKSGLVYEFIVQNDPQEDDQHEVGVIYADEEGVYVFHYVTKDSPMSEREKIKWIGILQNGLKEDGSGKSEDSGF